MASAHVGPGRARAIVSGNTKGVPMQALQPRCPPQQRVRILSTLSRLCTQHLGERPKRANPRDVDELWRLSGGDLGKIRSHVGRVAKAAAERGLRGLDAAVFVNRWGAA